MKATSVTEKHDTKKHDTDEAAGCLLLSIFLFTIAVATGLGLLAAIVYIVRCAWVAAS